MEHSRKQKQENKGKYDSNLIKQNCDIENIKSKFIIQKVLANLTKKNLLEIVKYNNKIKKIIDININNYKEFREKYSTIEIEVIPVENEYYRPSEFINIEDGKQLYFHIYFNNNKDEIKRNYITKEDKVSKINIIIDYQIDSFKCLFFKCKCIKSIYFKKFYRNNITNMCDMFYGCTSLKEIDLSNFNTENVTDMDSMFLDCHELKKIDLSCFKTDKVTNMRAMFSGCWSLKEIDISNFNFNNVIDMVAMFDECNREIKKKVESQNGGIKFEAIRVYKRR